MEERFSTIMHSTTGAANGDIIGDCRLYNPYVRYECVCCIASGYKRLASAIAGVFVNFPNKIAKTAGKVE
jgi:hypothetical protein